jgi:hypothetical protein
MQRASLEELGGAPVTVGGEPLTITVTVWPARQTFGASGRHFDYEGEAPRAYADDLRVRNRQLRIGRKVYKIIEAIPHDFLPHVALELKETA